MSVREFEVPTEDEWIDFLGVAPEPAAEQATVHRWRYNSDDGGTFELTFDIAGSSVRLQWLNGERAVLDIFREGARRLTTYSGQGEARLVVTFETEDLRGEIVVQLLPEFRISDNLLFH